MSREGSKTEAAPEGTAPWSAYFDGTRRSTKSSHGFGDHSRAEPAAGQTYRLVQARPGENLIALNATGDKRSPGARRSQHLWHMGGASNGGTSALADLPDDANRPLVAKVGRFEGTAGWTGLHVSAYGRFVQLPMQRQRRSSSLAL